MPKSVVNSLHPISNNWQQQLAEAITAPHELLSLLQLSPQDFPDCHLASEDFQLRVTRAFAAKMVPGDPQLGFVDSGPRGMGSAVAFSLIRWTQR